MTQSVKTQRILLISRLRDGELATDKTLLEDLKNVTSTKSKDVLWDGMLYALNTMFAEVDSYELEIDNLSSELADVEADLPKFEADVL